MSRYALGAGLLVACAGFGGLLADGPAPPPKPPALPRPADLCEKLHQPAAIDKAVENTPLKDVLDFLSDRYEVSL